MAFAEPSCDAGQQEARRSLVSPVVEELIQRSLGSPVERLIAAASWVCAILVSPIRTSSLAVGDTSLGGDRAHARVG